MRHFILDDFAIFSVGGSSSTSFVCISSIIIITSKFYNVPNNTS